MSDTTQTTYEENSFLTIKEASEYMQMTRPCIYAGLQLKRLKFTVDENNKNRKLFLKSDLDDFLKHKYSRKKSHFQGKLLFEEGQFSIDDVSKKLEKTKNYVYCLVRNKKIGFIQKGCAYIITQVHIDEFLEKNPLKIEKKKKIKVKKKPLE
jgi:hypothetical protein